MSEMIITDVADNDVAVAAIVFAVTGPMSAGTMWLASFNNFSTMPPPVVVLLACGPAWMLAALLGTRSLRLICLSEGRLIGREYAVSAIVISGIWMVIALVALVLPGLFFVNS